MKSTRELQTVAQRIGQACLRPFTNRYCTAIPLPVQGSAREAEFAVITSADTAVSKAEQLRAITPMQRALLLKRLHKGER